MTADQSTWQDRLTNARAAGLLACELFVVLTEPAGDLEPVRQCLQEHLKYQEELEQSGKLFAAGPLSDETGTKWTGRGLIILRAKNLEVANKLAENDPMHRTGARKYSVLPWMLNEGRFNLEVSLSTKSVDLS